MPTVATRARFVPFVLCVLSACLDTRAPREGAQSGTPRSAAATVKPRRVGVPTVVASWGGDPRFEGANASLCQAATQALAAELARADNVLVDDSGEPVPHVLEVRGTLIGTSRGVRAIELRLVARGEWIVASARRETAPSANEFDLDALAQAAREIAHVAAELPWSAAITEKAERLLVTPAGRADLLRTHELLIVRLAPEWTEARGSAPALRLQGREVARVVVDSFLERDGQPAGACCKLIGGTFGGFALDEIVLEEP